MTDSLLLTNRNLYWSIVNLKEMKTKMKIFSSKCEYVAVKYNKMAKRPCNEVPFFTMQNLHSFLKQKLIS